MEGLSERQYAARVGLSRGAIQKAKATGRLVLHADGHAYRFSRTRDLWRTWSRFATVGKSDGRLRSRFPRLEGQSTATRHNGELPGAE